MKRVAIFCVNYNSYQELYHYLDSICVSAKEAKDAMKVDVFVADNSDQQPQEITYEPHDIHLRVFPFHQNLGYFGAIRKMMEEVSPLSYDYTVISNVDVLLHIDTLKVLCNYQTMENTSRNIIK